jgi:MFS transporter, UMF1 family
MSTKPSSAPAARIGIASWALFEWARNPYWLVIVLYIYAPYFANEIVPKSVDGQILWGEIAAYSGLAVAILAPFFGAIADAGGRRKPWILAFTLMLVAAECALWLGQPGASATMLIVLGAIIGVCNFAYEGSYVFHSAMLPSLVKPERVGVFSGLGYALGNGAGLVLLLFVLLFIYLPEHPLLGLDKAAHEHERIVGPLCAVWLLAFSLPFFAFTPDHAPGARHDHTIRRGLIAVLNTVKSLRPYRNVGIYLIARALYNDGLTGMMLFGGVYATGVFRWHDTERALFGIVLSICAALGGFFGGRLGDRIGARRAILWAIAGTMLGALLSLGFAPDRIFYFFPVVPGEAVWPAPVFKTLPEILYVVDIMFVAVCVVGAYANSRTMLARIAPEERMAEFFGLFALSGTATAFLAPAAVAWVTAATQSQQGGMAAILGFLGVGFVVMLFVREVRATPV